MPTIDPHIFRAYDIRGKAGTQLTAEACKLIGHAFGATVRELYKKEHPSIILGRDARLSSPEFEAAMTEGLVAAGCAVLRMGQTPSPVNYFTICDQSLDGGVQITASHNPGHDNGIKLQIRNAEAFSGEELQTLRKRIEARDLPVSESAAPAPVAYDALPPYVAHLVRMFPNTGEGSSLIVDGGNGVAGPLYAEVLEKIGCKVEGLYLEPDGTFPNHPADPSKWDTLKDLRCLVTEHTADMGIAFDGDGDRVGIVDETGTIRTADDILLLLAHDLLSRHAGATIVFTVSNSSVLETEISKWGGKTVMCKVGHSHVEHAMRDNAALLGGEQSGHFFCAEGYFGFDDALMAAIRIVTLVRQSGTTFSELCARFPRVYQAEERRPHCPDDKKTEVVERIAAHFSEHFPVNTLDGVRIDFGEGAWAGIRKSNTSPCLSVCMEAMSETKLREVESVVMGHLSEYPEIDLEG